MAAIRLPALPSGSIHTNPDVWQDYLFQLDEVLNYGFSNLDDSNFTDGQRLRISRMESAAKEVQSVVEALGYFASIKRVAQIVDAVDGKNTIFYTETAPEEKNTGDIWYKRDVTPTQILRWTGIAWDNITDVALSAALERAADARAIADQKIRTYYTTTAPQGLTQADEGDLWVNSGTSVISRWSGSAWITVQDITNYVNHNNDGVNIKSTDGRFRAVVSSTALAFYQQDAWIAEFSNNRLYTNKVEVVNGITLGDGAKKYYDMLSGLNTLTINYREG